MAIGWSLATRLLFSQQDIEDRDDELEALNDQDDDEGVDEDDDEDDDEEELSDDEDREISLNHAEQHQYNAGRSAQTDVAATLDVFTKKEQGVDDGDFRKKLQKAGNTKINTAAAFPQARPKGEQVDFRNVLKKTPSKENEVGSKSAKVINTKAAFPQARPKGEQVDFRNVLRKTDSVPKKVCKWHETYLCTHYQGLTNGN